jgi:hypothetical protein
MLHNRTVLLKLRNEIEPFPHATWLELENMPYMVICAIPNLQTEYGLTTGNFIREK